MTIFEVTARYDAGFGALAKPPGDEPVTRARMLTAGSGASTSDFTAEVDADSSEAAIAEAMVAITRQAAWRGITSPARSVEVTR